MKRSRPAKSTISSNRRSISRLGQPEDRAVQVDVLPAGQLGVEPGAELEQRRHRAAVDDAALVRREDLGEAFEQRRLARSVLADDAERLALLDLEGHVLQRPELLVAGPPAAESRRFEVLVALVVEAEAFGHLICDDHRFGHCYSSSAKRGDSRPKTHTPTAKVTTAITTRYPKVAAVGMRRS